MFALQFGKDQQLLLITKYSHNYNYIELLYLLKLDYLLKIVVIK